MSVLNQEQLAAKLLEFARRERSVLFTGAGVGKRVKLPLWGEYIEYLATICEKFGATTEAEFIRHRLRKGKLIDAAGVYADTDEIPLGERWRYLAEPFRGEPAPDDLEALSHVFKLPFEAVITTNYDSSQAAAYCLTGKKFPVMMEKEGTSMLAGADSTSFYIARIHGNADAPKSMVLYPGTYNALREDEGYQDFLLSLFRSRPCLFIGFSFVDPAIEMVLDTYQRKAKEIYQVPHLALLPDEPDAKKLTDRLTNLNIEAHYYAPDEGHKVLWKAFRQAAAEFSKSTGPAKVASPTPLPTAAAFHRFLSFTYAQVKLSKEFQPLLQQAREGIILGIIKDAGEDGAEQGGVVEGLQSTLSLDQAEASKMAMDGTAQLFREKRIRIEGERLKLQGNEYDSLTEALNSLADGVLDRLKVQFDVTPKATDKGVVCDALEHVFLVRAWDLGAHYAGGGGGYGEDTSGLLRSRIRRHEDGGSNGHADALATACADLLQNPSNSETEHLAEISRAAFSLQLVLASPRQSLFKAHALPHRVYFDASVLLPAIVPGHPYNKLYRETVERLLKAASQAGVDCKLCVGQPFLNEVISHRERAMQIAESIKADNSEELRKTVLLFGAENLNVFISGYAGISAAREVGKKKKVSFRQFLNEYAPYGTEDALQERLEGWGFEIEPMNFRQKHNDKYVAMLNGLLTGYEEIKADLVRGKERVLVEHEALQLAQLAVDAEGGLRSVFVSNDRKLRKAASIEHRTKQRVSSILPPESFVGLVDIVVGSRPDPRGLARLIWAAPRRESDQILRDYLVKKALLEQDVAQAKASAEVISEIIAEAKEELDARPVDLTDSGTAESVAEAVNFFDRFEDRFFEKMRKAMERQES